ncbi:DUF6261 family protein [Aquimarina mytili]|uniref:Uncharacterized protein n=1 Tax=Aquimarina mytili TaxID=874423 RepID=A0A937D878_9FLAO|nr:DUF6261 family protein [Aquimarina mytili]MBL0683800.1 hypothetical protein [Aquimarina mytili]
MNTPYLNRYRNGEFLQYMKDILELVNQQDVDALQLTSQKNALEPIVNNINTVFQQSQGSTLTQEIIALDERRDRAIIGIRGASEAFTYHYDQGMAEAANTVLTSITTHGDGISRLSYQQETAILGSVVQDFETEIELKTAIMKLGLTKWVAELKNANDSFASKYLDRVGQAAANPTADIAELRSNATEAYRTLVAHIKAHATLGTAKGHAIILDQIDILAGQYNQVIENRSSNSANDDTSTEA